MKIFLSILFSLVFSAGPSLASLTCGVGVETPVTFSATDKSTAIVLSNGGLTASASSSVYDTARASLGRSSGKYFFEATLLTSPRSSFVGIANSSAGLTNYLGYDSNAWGFQDNGTVGGALWHAGNYSAIASTFRQFDVVGVAVDLDAGVLSFYVNGTFAGSNSTGITGTLYPAVALYSGGGTASFTFNFGASAFRYTPPTGFEAWQHVSVCTGQFVCADATTDSCARWVDAFPTDRATFDQLGLTGEAIGLSFAFGCGLTLALWGLSVGIGSATKIINAFLGSP